MATVQILYTATVICFLQGSSAVGYEVYRNSIESPMEYNFPDGMNWAEKLHNANIEDYEMRKYSKLTEKNNLPLNNTIYATMERKNSDEDCGYFPGNLNPFEDVLKQNTSETKMHTYEYPHSYPGKGEILVHRPAPIIVRRPATKVLINHPPLIVKPSPVIFHRPPPLVMRPTVIKTLPQKVKIEPKYLQVIHPTRKVVIPKNSDYREEMSEPERNDFHNY